MYRLRSAEKMRDNASAEEVEDLSPVNQYTLDYFRCPDIYAAYQLTGDLSYDRGFFRWDKGTVCYGRTAYGSRAATPEAAAFDVEPEVDGSGAVPRGKGRGPPPRPPAVSAKFTDRTDRGLTARLPVSRPRGAHHVSWQRTGGM